MGVEFFEENKPSTISATPQKQGGFAEKLLARGLTKSVSGGQLLLLCVGLLSLFGTYFVFSLKSDARSAPPTRAEIQAMAALLKK